MKTLIKWVHLCVGVASLVEVLFRGSQYKSTEGISLGGTLKLRRIFSLLNSPSDEIGLSALPRAFHISSVNITMQASGTICDTLLYRLVKVVDAATLYSSTDSASDNLSSSNLKPTHIAFGKKVPIPDHILGSRQQQV